MGGVPDEPIRVVVVDDQDLVRAGLRMLLDAEEATQVVGEASDGEDAVDAVLRAKPDVVLMDVQMPGLDGIEATKRLFARSADAPGVIMLTTFDVDEYVYEALRAGASGFLLKDAPPEQLIGAIRTVAAGDGLLAPSVTRRLIAQVSSGAVGPTRRPPELDELTARELEVLGLIARGLSNAEIAAELVLSEATVKSHVARMLMKLGLRDRVQAVVLAYESGLVQPGGGA